MGLRRKKKEYPTWVCAMCGLKYGRGVQEKHVCTWHTGECGVCGDVCSVTEPRDFGHLMPGWETHCST
jgi:hypothetical protein